MGTVLSFTRNDIQPGRSSQTATFAYAVLQFAKATNANITDSVFDTVEGWQSACRVTGISDTETKDTVDLEGGLPMRYFDSIVTAIRSEVQVTGTAWRKPMGLQIASGSEIAIVTVYGATTTTVASVTDTKTIVLTSATGFAVGDTIEFDLDDATYGGFKQADKIKAIDSNTVTLEDGLDYAPATGTNVKKVVSYTSYEGGGRLQEYKFRLIEYYTNGDMDISYYGVGKISAKTKNVNDGTSAKDGTFTFKVVARTATLTDTSGSSCSKPFLKITKHISANGIC